MDIISRALCSDGSAPELWTIYQVSLKLAAERAKKAVESTGNVFDDAIVGLLDDKNIGKWPVLYEAEQRLIAYASKEEIEADFARRTVEAERLGAISVKALKESFDASADAAQRAALYRCLIEDVQFRYEKRRLDRKTRARMIQHYIWSGIGLSVITGAFLLIVLMLSRSKSTAVFNVPFVMLIGLCGAYFSRLTSFNSNADLDYDALVSSYRFRNLVLRGGIGMLAAVVMYYLIYSGLIAGDLFPAPNSLNSIASMFSGEDPLVPSKETAKLMVWAFIAGFSERLVTGTLERLENSDAVKSGSGQ